jgi:hypothetical protein
MTLDDLVEVYFKAWFEFTRNNKDFLPNESERNRTCIRAVVEALRDEVVLKIDAHNGCGILATETAIDATRDVFNEILAKTERSDLVKRLRAGDTLDIGEAADRIEVLESEVKRLTLNGIHTCHDNCQRLPCVQGREIRRLRVLLSRLFKDATTCDGWIKHTDAYEAVQKELEST